MKWCGSACVGENTAGACVCLYVHTQPVRAGASVHMHARVYTTQ